MACTTNAQNSAAAALVRTEYDAGRLGSRTDVRKLFANVPEDAYLDADGKLKPLGSMTPQARRDFLAWIVELDSGKRWHAQIEDAYDAGYRRAGCETQ